MHVRALLVLSVLALGYSASVSAAQAAEEPQRCLNLRDIRSMNVLDNQRILFEASGNRYFVNVLPHKCPGLRRNVAIMHRTSLDNICDLDVITVIESLGWSYMPGASCGLGRFNPVDADEAAALRKEK